jgi:cytochrome c biogenesis protein CcmG/thiol:disulfide interchange protein DsbE
VSATSPVPAEAPRPGRPGTARIVSAVLALVLVAFVAVLFVTDDDQDLQRQSVGQPVPPVAGTDLDGEPVAVADWAGQWVVVNFFATWCVPCIQEHPELVAFSEAHAGDPVQVVSVAFDDDPEAIEAFFAQRGGDWPVLAEDTGSIALDFGVRAVPESYLVAPDGTVVDVFIAGVTRQGLDEAIAAHGGLAAAGSASDVVTGVGGAS